MPHLHALLYVPDLVSVQFPANKDRARFLENFLSRAHISPVEDESAVLQGYFGLGAGELAIAALERLAGTGLRDSACWWRADPVHLAPDRDQLVMLPQKSLAVTREEMQQIAETFNKSYSAESFMLEASRPECGYLKVSKDWHCHGWDPQRIAGRAVTEFMPSGADEKVVRRLMTEIQMLLHEHPVNQAREAAGQPTINSLWLWGGGQLPARVTQSPARVITNLPLVQGLAKLAGQPGERWPVDLDVHDAGGEWLVALSMHEFDGDVSRVDRELVAPLWRMLLRGKVQSVQFYPGSKHIYELARPAARRFWRRTRSLSEFLREPDE